MDPANLNKVVTTTGGNLVVNFSCSATVTGVISEVDFQMIVDGVAVQWSGFTAAVLSQPEASTMLLKTAALGAGIHTVSIQWRVDGAGTTVSVTPGSPPANQHASLLIQEVFV
jgi:hypothetical protein